MENTNRVISLNKEQEEAATTLDGSLLIVAVAGSGKTTVLINRAVNLVASGVDPERILMITFTKYAANNMKNRAIKSADKNCSRIYTSTFHSFYSDMLRKYGGIIGMDTNFSILSTDGEIEDSLSETITSLTKYGNLKGFPAYKDIRAAYSYAINSGAPLHTVISSCKEFDGFEDEILNLYNLWVNKKNKENTYTFDDLMLKMYELLQNPEGYVVVSSLFDYIMVDEYQDINKLQNEILKLLSKDKGNVAVVGDDYQAIYRFRGSNVKYIENYEREHSGTKCVTIDTNYRSSDEIIQFVNSVMHHECYFGIKKEMKGIGRSYGPVIINNVEDEEDEAQHIVGEIIKEHNIGSPYSECAVLSRTAKALDKLEFILIHNSIPYERRGGTKFLDREEMRDMKALITCIVRPTNKNARLSWYRVLKELVRGVGEKTASELCEDTTIPDFLLLKKNQGSSFSENLVSIHKAIKAIRDLEKTNGMQEALKMLIAWYMDTRKELIRLGTGYKTESNRTEAYNELSKKMATLDTFMEIANDYATFVSLLDGISMNELSKSSSDNVCLSTIHSAKGLEWDNVYVLNAIEDIYPGHCNSDEDENESLRLFYVALTRAKKHLNIYVPHYIFVKNCYQEVKVSHFIRSTIKERQDFMKERFISSFDILHHRSLEFEMIPDTLYKINARSLLSETEWETISHNVRRIGVCACCGKNLSVKELEAHEVWKYDDKKHIQSLVDIIPVCKMCHATIHIGYSLNTAWYTENDLLEYYAKVNNITLEQAKTCFDSACTQISIRNEFNWEQDEISIRAVTRRYLKSERESQERKEVHYVNRFPYGKHEEFKEDCAKLGIKHKWDPINKRWGYIGDYCKEIENKWNN